MNDQIQIIYDIFEKIPKNFFFVLGDEVNKTFDNVFNINSMIVPSIGDEVHFQSKNWGVIKKFIGYSQVENHELCSDKGGKEFIYVFF